MSAAILQALSCGGMQCCQVLVTSRPALYLSLSVLWNGQPPRSMSVCCISVVTLRKPAPSESAYCAEHDHDHDHDLSSLGMLCVCTWMHILCDNETIILAPGGKFDSTVLKGMALELGLARQLNCMS